MSTAVSFRVSPVSVVSQLVDCIGRERAQEVLTICLDRLDQIVESAQMVAGGRGTSKIISLKAEEGDLICRVTDSARSNFYITTEKEIRVMKHVDFLKVAPKLHYAELDSNVIIMQQIRNVRLDSRMLDDSRQKQILYRALASTLDRLHHAPLPDLEVTNVFVDMKSTIDRANKGYMPPLALSLFEGIFLAEEVLNKHGTIALCHKDLHSNNVMYDGENIYLIDWELAALCDPFVDLGFASMFFSFDELSEEALLENYCKRTPTAEEKARFFLMKQVCLCLYASRLLLKVTTVGRMDLSRENVMDADFSDYRGFVLENYNGCSKSFSIEDLKMFAYRFLREAKLNMESPKFVDSINCLK